MNALRRSWMLLAIALSGCAGLVIVPDRYYVVDPPQAIELVSRGLADAVVDLRPPDDYNAGHIPGALSIPLSQLWIREDELPQDQGALILLYEDDPSRAERGALRLRQEGYYRIYALRGGFGAWIGAGGSVSHELAPKPGTGQGVETWF